MEPPWRRKSPCSWDPAWRESRTIVDKVQEMGDGDAAVGIIRTFAAGVLDLPFTPSLKNANKAMPIRDNDGLLRWFDFGSLPIPEDIKSYHREKVQIRLKKGDKHNESSYL